MKTIFAAIIFLAVLLYLAETKVTLWPFTIKFQTPEIAVGTVLLILALACFYHGGHKAGKGK